MDEQQRKAMLRQTFDAVSGGYDGGALRFFPQSAQSMVSLRDTQLAHIASVVKPGGKVMISSFQEAHYFHPLREMMLARLSTHAIAIPPPNWKRVGNEGACRALFDRAGLTNTRVEARNVGYYLDCAEQW